METFSKLLSALPRAVVWWAANASSHMPAAIALREDATVIATFHAEGAQLYECKADADNNLPPRLARRGGNFVSRSPH